MQPDRTGEDSESARVMRYVLGIDFDNTLVGYDEIIYGSAVQRGLIAPGAWQSKNDIRDRIRQLPDGEFEWQQLQAVVYGTRMNEAALIDGVDEFFESCKRYSVRTYVVSHKTEYVRLGASKINLRDTALAWMAQQKFFSP